MTTGCLLIIAGSLADLVGSRRIFLPGCFLQVVFVVACGVARTGLQLIIFRAMQGIALSFCLPTAVSIVSCKYKPKYSTLSACAFLVDLWCKLHPTSIITTAFPNGRSRNLGLGFMGAGQPLGFSIGLVLGGVFIQSAGWRLGYYMCAAANALVFFASILSLPQDKRRPSLSWQRLENEIDWVGAILASACLGMLSYVLA